MHLLFCYFFSRLIDIISCINLACYLHYICLTGELCDWSIDTELIEMTKWLRENVLCEVKCVCILRDIESRTWFVENANDFSVHLHMFVFRFSIFECIYSRVMFLFFRTKTGLSVYTQCARDALNERKINVIVHNESECTMIVVFLFYL